MNLFEYKARVKELEMCKQVGELEAFVRKYNNLCPKYTYSLKPEDKPYYKLYTLALKLFKEKSNRKLPDFLYDNHKQSNQIILSSLFEAHLPVKIRYDASNYFIQTPTYEEFIDWFEFDTHLDIPKSNWYVEQLNSIIGDKLIHFTIKFNYCTTSFDSASTKIINEHQILAYSIRYKQVNFPNKPQTIWDLFIQDNVSTAKQYEFDTTLNIESITKLKQQIKALETLPEYLS